MADNRSVVITLKLDKGGTELDVKNQTGGVGGSSSSGATQNAKDKASKAAYKALVVQAVSVVASEVVAWADYAWNRQLTLTDDYIGQRQKNIAMQQINTGISAVSSTLSGAAIGSAAGPIGAVIGAVIGFTSVALQSVRSNIQGQDQQSIMLRQMESQLDYTRARAGYSTKAASIGEDL